MPSIAEQRQVMPSDAERRRAMPSNIEQRRATSTPSNAEQHQAKDRTIGKRQTQRIGLMEKEQKLSCLTKEEGESRN